MVRTLPESQFDAALKAVEAEADSAEDKAEMLMEIAMGMQARPKTPGQLQSAVDLYRRALDMTADAMLRARITARLGTALQAQPDGGAATIRQARDAPLLAKQLALQEQPQRVGEHRPHGTLLKQGQDDQAEQDAGNRAGGAEHRAQHAERPSPPSPAKRERAPVAVATGG